MQARLFAVAALLLVSSSATLGAPTVVTGLETRASIVFPPLPTALWVATIDPDTLGKIADIHAACPPCFNSGGSGAADAHGRQAYATVWAGTKPAIGVIDTKLNALTAVIDTNIPEVRRLVADPVRARLYAAGDYPTPQLSVIDTRSLQVLTTIPLPPQTSGGMTSAVSEDGSRLYITIANTLAVVDLSSWSVVTTKALQSTPGAIAVNAGRNELYLGLWQTQGILVLAADSLAPLRTLMSPGSVFSLLSRSSDGVLLVETDSGEGSVDTRLDAIDPATGQRLATSTHTGVGNTASIDGRRVYRFEPGIAQPGQPFAEHSDHLLALDATSLATLGSAVLDARAADDPSRNGSRIVGTFIASVPRVSDAVEYFYAGLGHYFITSLTAEINALDTGMFPGWQRTGQTIPVYAQRDDGPEGSVAVCRFYGLPQKGLDSHFYSASATECAEVQQDFGDSWLLESSEVFDVYPADAATGACLFDTTPVYRVYNNRPDANHRYTTSLAIRNSMVAAGWVAEGYGADAVAFCAPR
jgi:hypothetical protein